MSGKLYISSICLSDLIDQAKARHKAFNKSEKNQKIYASLSIWINDEPDKYGNHLSISLISGKDEKKIYVGQGKKHENKTAIPQADSNKLDDDFPF